jgi:small GTP-binding protein
MLKNYLKVTNYQGYTSYDYDSEIEYDVMLKCIVVGDSDVGKSSLIELYTKYYSTINKTLQTTVGVDCDSRIETVDGTKYKLQIWDTAGQERFRSIIRLYYRSKDCAFIVFDISDYTKNSYSNASLHNLEINITKWVKEILEYGDADIPIVIVGNKTDRRKESYRSHVNYYSYDELLVLFNKMAIKHKNIQGYVETSVKDNIGIKEMFAKAIEKRNSVKNISSMDIENSDSVVKKKEKNQCCVIS